MATAKPESCRHMEVAEEIVINLPFD